ncbi:MAG: prolipoprotein diacylglyceryl transferase [Proteobacteria bacterium]|nr:prolipoprotein diacylglyceryl transferase [Pseudomonadota bacterium]
MYPILFRIYGLTIYTYGFFVAMGFLAGIYLIKYESRRLGENPEKILDLAFYSVLAAIIGARVFYIATDPSTFLNDPVEIIRIWNGGLVFYGGFISVFIVAIIYIRFHKMKFWQTLDIASPSIAIGHSIGRLGCFFAGCCYGRECHLPWAITFTHPESLAPLGVSLHPTQLYASISNLMLFLFLFSIRKRKKFDGQLFCIYMILYALLRMVNEYFRGDFRGNMGIFSFSPSQSIALVMALIFSLLWFFLWKRAAKGTKGMNHHA